MQSIAAYYLLIANDMARAERRPRYAVPVPRRTFAGRISTALAGLVRHDRRGAAQPA